MRILVNFMRRDGWSIHCLAEEQPKKVFLGDTESWADAGCAVLHAQAALATRKLSARKNRSASGSTFSSDRGGPLCAEETAQRRPPAP